MKDNIDRINDYFKNKLNTKEKELFENEWEKDDTLAQEIAFYLKLRDELKEEKREKILSVVTENDNSFFNQEREEKRNNIFSIRSAMKLAASVIVLLGVFLLYNTLMNNVDVSIIASEYDKPYNNKELMEDVNAHKGMGTTNLEEQQQIMNVLDSLFKNNKTTYLLEADRLMANEEITLFSRETELMKAIALKELNKNASRSKAKSLLKNLKEESTTYRDVILWHLSMIYLLEEDQESGVANLESIVENYPNSEYTDSAKSILSKLR